MDLSEKLSQNKPTPLVKKKLLLRNTAYQTRILDVEILVFNRKTEIKMFSDKQTLREFISRVFLLQEVIKFFRQREKRYRSETFIYIKGKNIRKGINENKMYFIIFLFAIDVKDNIFFPK